MKPLLSVFNYDQLRLLNRVLVLVTTAALCGLPRLRKLGRYIPPYLLALLLIDPTSIGRSLQFSAVYYVFTLACIVFLAGRRWFLASEQRIVLFFVVLGCVSSYFDLLTYPLVAFGVPAALYLRRQRRSENRLPGAAFLPAGLVLRLWRHVGLQMALVGHSRVSRGHHTGSLCF